MPNSDRRDRILEAAKRLFLHYGPFKTTVADIAREAEVGVGTVYLEFQNKDTVLGALSRQGHARVLSAMREALFGAGTFEHRLRLAIDARLDAFVALSNGGAHGPDLFRACCPAVGDAHAEFHTAELDLLTRFLTQAKQSGTFVVDEPDEEAAALRLAYRAFAPPSLFEYPIATMRRRLPRVHRIVLYGLVVR